MSHANAALTPCHRLRIARLIVDDGWPVVLAAHLFNVSWPTAKRCAERYAAMGATGDGQPVVEAASQLEQDAAGPSSQGCAIAVEERSRARRDRVENSSD